LLPGEGIEPDAKELLGGNLQEVGAYEWLMFKPRWGAFYATPLERHLAALGVDTVVVCGCNFPNCPRATLYEASERDLRVAVVTDATPGFDDRDVDQMRSIGVGTEDTETLIQWLGTLSRSP